MKRRILSLLLAVTMLLGMLPMHALAADSTAAASLKGHPAAYAATVNIDGKADETAWALSGNLSDGTDFGFLWNNDELYFALDSKTAPALKINGTACTPTAVTEDVYEAKVAFGDLGLRAWEGRTLDVEITCGTATFTGVVELDTLIRSFTHTLHGSTANIAGGTSTNLGFDISVANTYRMWNKYNSAATDVSGGQVYAQFRNLTPLQNDDQIRVVEFDFYAENMPVVDSIASVIQTEGYNYAGRGLSLEVCYAADYTGYIAGINNTSEGLVFCVAPPSGKSVATKAIGKNVGEKFHVRLEHALDGNLYMYADDELILVYEGIAKYPKTTTAYRMIMRLWTGKEGSGIALTEDGKNDMDFTVSNLAINSRTPASPMAPDHPAAYAASVTLDGKADEKDWAFSGKMSSGSGLGFLWNAENLYLALENKNALTLEINGNAYTPAAANVVTDSVQEVCIPLADLDMTANGGETLDVAITCGDETYQATVVLEGTVRTVEPSDGQYGIAGHPDNVAYEFENGIYHMWAKYNADAVDTDTDTANGLGGRVYAIFNNVAPLGVEDLSQIVEFDFTSTDMPVVSPAWDGDWYYSYNGGLCMVISKGKTAGYIIGIHNTESGLVFFVNPDSGQSPTMVSIGKTVGDSFHVRLEQMPDGDLLAYVDDKLILTHEDAGKQAWGGVSQLIMNLWNGKSTNGIELAEDGSGDIDITVSNLVVGNKELPGQLLSGLTFDQIKGENTVAESVKKDLALPAALNGNVLKNVGLTWTSSHPDLVSAAGKVTLPASSTIVTLTAALTADPTVTKTFTVTVPSYELFATSATLADSLALNFYVYKSEAPEGAVAVQIDYKDNATVIPMEDWDTASDEIGEMWKISFPSIAAKEMTEVLTVSFLDAEGNAVGKTRTDSVANYAYNGFGNGLDTLLVDMLNYGAAAQTYFGYNTDDLANADLTEEQLALASDTVEAADLLSFSGSYYGTSLFLKDTVRLNFYFAGLTDDMTAEVFWTNHYGTEKTATPALEKKGAYHRVIVSDLAVADAFQLVTCNILDAEGNVVASATDSIEGYCARIGDALPLGQELMKFAQSAWDHFHPSVFTNVIMHLGADESQLNYTWYYPEELGTTSTITYAPTADMVGRHFPETAVTVTATPSTSVKEGYSAAMATITGLEPATAYTYQLRVGNEVSGLESFTTAGSGDFSFAVVGDPQIGRGQIDGSYCEEALDQDHVAWGRTLNQMLTDEHFEDVSFFLSMGDNINSAYTDTGNAFSYANHEHQFDHFANHEQLLQIPMAATFGNHDSYDYAVFPFHFNQPNRDATAGAKYDNAVTDQLNITDYYYVYNNVLFITLNNLDIVANKDDADYTAADKAAADAHGAFIARVMEETKDLDIKWKIVTYHASPFGSSYHNDYTLTDSGTYKRTEQYAFVNMRQYLIPYFHEYGIDLVLSGHDHTYSRTNVIKPKTDEDGNYLDDFVTTGELATGGTVTNPDGIIHVTAATSSGSGINEAYFKHYYTAVKAKANERQMIRIDVTDNSLTLVNYNLGTRTADEVTEIDSITIYKN